MFTPATNILFVLGLVLFASTSSAAPFDEAAPFDAKDVRVRGWSFNKSETMGPKWTGDWTERARPDEFVCGYRFTQNKVSGRAEIEIEIDPKFTWFYAKAVAGSRTGPGSVYVSGRVRFVKKTAMDLFSGAACDSNGWSLRYYKDGIPEFRTMPINPFISRCLQGEHDQCGSH